MYILMVFQDICYLFILITYKLILASLGNLKGLSKQIIYWPKNFWNQLFMRICDEFKENEYLSHLGSMRASLFIPSHLTFSTSPLFKHYPWRLVSYLLCCDCVHPFHALWVQTGERCGSCPWSTSVKSSASQKAGLCLESRK